MSNPTVKINDWVRQQFPMAVIVLGLVFLIIQVVPLVNAKPVQSDQSSVAINREAGEKLERVYRQYVDLATSQTVAFERLTTIITAQTKLIERVTDRLEQMNATIGEMRSDRDKAARSQ